MRKFNQSPISVTFFPKKNKRGRAVIYCTISFKGTQTKLSTGIRCEDPEKHWRSGAFEGRNFNDENYQLQTIRKEFESMDPSFYSNADEIKRILLDEKKEQINLTIVTALYWGFEQKKRKVKRSHVDNLTSGLTKFENYLHNNNFSDWSILSKHPSKVTRVKVIEYYNWMLDNGARSSANTSIGVISSLYEVYYMAHYDSIPDLIPNVFSKMQEYDDKQDRIYKAISRKIDWSIVEKIDEIRPNLHNIIFDKETKKIKKANRPIKKSKERKHALGLLTMIIANTGLSFVDFGKADVLDISHIVTMKNRELQLSSRRVKTGMNYRIPIDKNVAEMIKELKPIMPWKPYVNAERDYHPKDKARAYRMYRDYLFLLSKAIEYKGKLTPHRFRHTFAMRQLNDKGLNLETVAEMLGDTIKTTSENYANYTDKTIQENYNKQTTKHSEMLLRQS